MFEKTGKNITLSVAGFHLLPHAKAIVESYEKEIGEFEGWKQGYNRKLTIAVAPQIAASVLPSFLRTFIDEHPDIQVIINVVRSFDIGEEISLAKADIGLSRMKPIQTDIKYEVIHRDPVILVAPSNEQLDIPLNEVEVLRYYRLLTNNHPSYWNTLLLQIKSFYPRIRSMPVTQIETTKLFIEKGLGVSYLPLSMIQEELNSKKIIEVKQHKITPPTSFTYVVTKVETSEGEQFITSFVQALSE